MRDKYAEYLENKLVTDFKQKFEEKLGYKPIVITKVKTTSDGDTVLHLSLAELEDCFEPFLPVHFGGKLPLQSKCRKRDMVELRNMFCAIARNMGYTHAEIGKFLGGRDHTTVIHNVRTFNDLISYNELYMEKYKRIIRSIKLRYESPDLEQLNKAFSEPEPAVLS